MTLYLCYYGNCFSNNFKLHYDILQSFCDVQNCLQIEWNLKHCTRLSCTRKNSKDYYFLPRSSWRWLFIYLYACFAHALHDFLENTESGYSLIIVGAWEKPHVASRTPMILYSTGWFFFYLTSSGVPLNSSKASCITLVASCCKNIQSNQFNIERGLYSTVAYTNTRQAPTE